MGPSDYWPTEIMNVATRLWADATLSPTIIAKILRCTRHDLDAMATRYPEKFPVRPEISEQETEQLILRQRMSAIAGISVGDFDEVVARLHAREPAGAIARHLRINPSAVALIRKTLKHDEPPRVQHQKRIPITPDQRSIILAGCSRSGGVIIPLDLKAKKRTQGGHRITNLSYDPPRDS